MDLTPNTHHLVRDALQDATIINVVHTVRQGSPDSLFLLLDTSEGSVTVEIRGERLDLRFVGGNPYDWSDEYPGAEHGRPSDMESPQEGNPPMESPQKGTR